MSSKRSAVVIISLSVALVLSLFRGCEPEADWLVKHGDPDSILMWEGYAVSSGLFLYAEKNGRLPRTLDELKPDYVGAAVDLSHYTLLSPGATNWVKWSGIARGVVMTTRGERIISISGHGHVGVYLPGQS